MKDWPARKQHQVERHKALRQQARTGDPVAQAQVDALNARNRASVARAKAAGRDYRYPERKALRRAEERAAVVLTPEQAEQARQRRDRRAAAQRKREVAAAKPPRPLLSAEAHAAQAVASNRARNRASYRAIRQRMAAGDADARAKYEQRLADKRQRDALKTVKLTPEQRSETARQGALKRWSNRAAPGG